MTKPHSTLRMSRRQFTLLAGGSAAVMSLGLSCLVQAQSTSTVRVRLASDIGNLDPARIFQIENQSVASHIFNGLVKYDPASNAIVPDLASAWTVDGGKVYTFTLREGVTFHKGHGPFTADDVKFSFERVLDPKTASAYAGQLAAIERIETPTPQTVVITLKSPNAGFLHKVAAFNQGWIVSRKAVTEMGDEKVRLNPVGTGPFVFERWTPGQEVSLSANPDYFEGAPKVGSVVFRIIRDETASAIALENGEIDVFFSLQQPEVIARLKQGGKVTVLDRPANHTINLVLNTTVKPLDDVRVRRAIAYAINRPALLQGFFKGTKGEAFNVLTSSFPEYSEDVPRYDYDPAKARELLKEAGVGNFTLELVTPAAAPYDKLVVPMASDLMAVGIQCKLQILERGTFLQARAKGTIPTSITGVVGAPDPDSPILTLYSKASFPPGLNTAHYAGIEDLIAAAATAPDDTARKVAYGEILKKTMADVPVIPLYADHLFIAHGPRVKGFVQNSLFTVNVAPVALG
ncbi:ABC transporter substrate-binding protein [Achromobacter sp. GG226]|uniref:ABC transporter substrate-binding protein n=1 Tax=Verticiella alkaliphila TaxID=2779529 RepID=UPI00209AA746|nr:ABC transporter substrate-binding protein [Verticiella sp. GG226]MBU4610250.1 ABC transporter substrate-binding protein [Verticiella sp. GG226]